VRRRAAPAAVLPLATALTALAFLTDHPVLLLAVAVGAAVLLWAAPAPPGPAIAFGAAVAAFFALLNPFVSTEGNLILVPGPHTVILDLEVTLEELVYGIAAGVRVLAVAMLTAAALALVDADRLLARATRLAPRSALTVALAVRLLPTLRRDARAIDEAARLRGLAAGGGARATLRRWAPLLVPLTATSLERGLDQAEAMTARGFGSAHRTHRPEPPLSPGERVVAALGVALLALAVALRAADLAPYAYYPTLADPWSPAALVVAALLLVVVVAAAAALRRAR
jgi:energy-coupling factor transport system permease protein